MIVLNQFIKALCRFCLYGSFSCFHYGFLTGNRLKDEPNKNDIGKPVKHAENYICKFVR